MKKPAPAIRKITDGKKTRMPPSRIVTDGKKANSMRSGKILSEGLANVSVPDGVFFNPAMHLCRDLSSLWVGTLPPISNALDAFCASGIRGFRYKSENKNLKSVTFLDAHPAAFEAVKKNIELNEIAPSCASVACSSLEVFLSTHFNFDLIEIDPFGTPAPYLPFVMRSAVHLKEFYLSATATDTAVLCGAHAHACLNQYNSKPLDNEFCHENALRILLGHLARAASQYDFALHPQVCFSDRHYVKVMVCLQKSAPDAVHSSKLAMKHLSHCPKCLWREMAEFPSFACPLCGSKCNWAGPLWGGALWEKETIHKMQTLASSRKYLDEKQTLPILSLIASECEIDAPFYFDLHELASRHKRQIPKTDSVLSSLRKAGFFASRTHFKMHSIRTNAGLEEVLQAMPKGQ